MPLLKPTKNEKRDAFIGRCINSSKMKKEFKNKAQRGSVCISLWQEEQRQIIK